MCDVENLIHRRRAELKLTQEDIAEKMTGYLGEPIQGGSVGQYLTGYTGVPLEKIGAFLCALGLKVVNENEICLTPDIYNGLNAFARKYLEGTEAKK